VVKGLTIASGIVSVASTVASAAGNPEAVTVFTQLLGLLKAIGSLFGG
jgi:hypothetical protein